MGKGSLARFFKGLSVKATGSDRGISGHSARVEGAQAMAKAGISLPIIQLFGRWGSNAVMKYVRDTLLGIEGGDISRQLALRDEGRTGSLVHNATQQVATSLPRSVKDEVRVAIAELKIEQAYAESLRHSAAVHAEIRTSVEEVLKVANDTRRDLDVITGVTAPHYIMNQEKQGKLHVVLAGSHAVCGWNFDNAISATPMLESQVSSA